MGSRMNRTSGCAALGSGETVRVRGLCSAVLVLAFAMAPVGVPAFFEGGMLLLAQMAAGLAAILQWARTMVQCYGIPVVLRGCLMVVSWLSGFLHSPMLQTLFLPD